MRTLSKIQFILLVLTVAIPVVSYAVDGKIKIGQTPSTTFPIVISESGSYVLTSNLQVSTNFSCIQISADNVTLDLNGFALTGPGTGSGGSGIYVNGHNNITIVNGTVKDFMGSGVYFLSSSKVQLKDLRCSNNGQRGMYVENATVVNCIAEENGTDGIRAYYSTVRDCTSNDNTDDGLDVLSSTVLNCQAYSNDNRGIYSRRSSITNCTITFSGDHGIEAYDSTINNCTSYANTNNLRGGIHLTDSIATDCTANGNYSGFSVENSTLTNCTANMNTYRGFYALYSTLTNCTANNNDHGFGVNTSILTNCNAKDNSSSGIGVGGRSVVTNCNANDNTYGIRVYSSCRIEGNNVCQNTYGIYLMNDENGDNYVIKNTASDNSSGNFQNDGTNNYMPLTGDNRNYSF